MKSNLKYQLLYFNLTIKTANLITVLIFAFLQLLHQLSTAIYFHPKIESYRLQYKLNSLRMELYFERENRNIHRNLDQNTIYI